MPRWLVPALVLMAVGAMAWGLGRMAVPDPSNGAAAPAGLPLEEPVALPLPVRPVAQTAPVASSTPAPTPAAPAGETPVPAPATRADTPVEPPRSPAIGASQAPAPTPAEVPAPAPAAPSPDSPAPGAPSAAVDAEAGLDRLSDLPAAQRAALPELRISMHVYAEDPERRFAIIDGRRVGEGALLPGGVVVEAIRREGIVVDLDGRRVLLPRP